jgi:hypothetical protein
VSKKVFLHVGLPKSGTSYLQAVLAANKSRLADRAHLLFPGSTWQDQVRAVRDVRSAKGHAPSEREAAGEWARLVHEISTWQGDAVVSMEWLAGATSREATRIVESLAPGQVELVVTVRDLARTIPAAWQEFLQNEEVWSWSEFLGAVTSENPRGTPAGNLFWSQQDLGKILATWRDALASERMHVVTVPQAGAPAGELWTRFASVLGIDGSLFDASGQGSNESLGRESAELMLRLNRVSRARGMEWSTYEEMFKHTLAKQALSKRKHVETPQHRIPPDLQAWTVARTAEQVRAIEASGAGVVGDLSDLESDFGPPDPHLGETSCEGILEAALEGLVALAKDRRAELERLRQRNARLTRQDGHVREQARPRESARAVLRRPLRRAYRSAIAKVRRSATAR